MNTLIRRANERGLGDHGWLKSRHTFSFANYYDPRFMGFSDLRVINEDRVRAGRGFGTHPHRDMEIISYVLEGELGHRDSMGNGSIIRPGDVQLMSAGTGVTHSEMNASAEHPVHFLQIWIHPNVRGQAPGYQQQHFEPTERDGRFRLLVSPDGDDGSLTIKQDGRVFGANLEPEAVASFTLGEGRAAWLHIARGMVEIDGQTLTEGDAIAWAEPETLEVRGLESAELLLFDLRGTQ